MFLKETQDKVIGFLKSKKDFVTLSEIQYLGQKKMQISYPQIKDILFHIEHDLTTKKHIQKKINTIGKRTFVGFKWVK
jgi:hypothetical protein